MVAKLDDFYSDLEALQQQNTSPPQSKTTPFPVQQAQQQHNDFFSDLEAQQQPTALAPAQQGQAQPQQPNDFFSDLEKLQAVSEKPRKETAVEKKQVGLLESFKQGLGKSVSGELQQQFFEPGTQQELASNPGFWNSLVQDAGTITGDLPYMAAGATLGGLIGSPAGPIGAGVGASFGTFALPAFLKEATIQYRDFQEKGGDLTFGEFLQRADKVANRTLNEGLFGVILGLVKPAIPLLEKTPIGAMFQSKIVKKATEITAEAGVATAVPAAARGELPTGQDFAHALALFTGFNLVMLPANAREAIQKQGEKSGLTPEEFASNYNPEQAARIKKVVDQRMAKEEAKISPEKPSKEAPSFTTEKGSVYQVNEDGSTSRYKAARPEHPGDQGLKQKSEKTWFVSPEDAQKLGEVQTSGDAKRLFQFHDGKVGVQYIEGPNTGKVESRTVIEPQTEPAVGLIPVEIWQDGKEIHFGNKITDVKAKPVELPKGAILRKPEDIVIGGKTGASVPVPGEKGGFFPHDLELTKEEKLLSDGSLAWSKAGDQAESSKLAQEAREMIFARIKGNEPAKLEIRAPEAKEKAEATREIIPEELKKPSDIHVGISVNDIPQATIPITKDGKRQRHKFDLTEKEKELILKMHEEADPALRDQVRQMIFDRITEPEMTAPKAKESHPTLKDIPQEIYRGYGREKKESVYGNVTEPILGEGKYYAFNEEAAKEYGPNIESKKIDLENPLVIRNDAEWRAFTKKAGLEFPNPVGMNKADTKANVEKIQNEIRKSGHDGAVIYWEPLEKHSDYNKQGKSIKTLSKVFDVPQVFELPKATKAQESRFKKHGATIPPAIQQILPQKGEKAPTQTVKDQHGKDIAIPKTFYHATIREIKGELKPDARGVVHFADAKNDVLEANRSAASRAGKQGQVITKDLDLNKVFVTSKKYEGPGYKDPFPDKAKIDQMKKAGYDGIYYPEEGIFEYFTDEPIDLEHLKQVKKERLLINAETFRWKNPEDKAEFIRRVNEGSFGPGEANKFVQGKVYQKGEGPTEEPTERTAPKAKTLDTEEIAQATKEKSFAKSIVEPVIETTGQGARTRIEYPKRGMDKIIDKMNSFIKEAKTPAESLKRRGEAVNTAIFNALAPLEKLEKDIPVAARATTRIKIAQSAASEINSVLENGIFSNMTGNFEHGGLKEAYGDLTWKKLSKNLKPHEYSLEDLDVYRTSKVALRRQAEGKKTGIDTNQAKIDIARLKEKYEPIDQRIRAFQQAALNAYGKDLLGPELIKKWNSQYYSPLYRVMEEGKDAILSQGSLKPKQPFKKMEGSERKIIPPSESDPYNVAMLVRNARKNDAVLQYKGLVVEGKLPGRIKAAKPNPITEEAFEALGVDPEMKPIAETLYNQTRTDSFTPEKNIIRGWQNGKPFDIEVPEEIYNIFSALTPQQRDPVTKMFGAVNKLFSRSISMEPRKFLSIMSRDALSSLIYSKTGSNPISVFEALADVWKGTPVYKEFLSMGGDVYASRLAERIDRAKKVEDLITPGKEGILVPFEKIGDFFRKYSDILGDISLAVPLAEYKRAIAKYGNTEEGRLMAAMEARRVTYDPTRKGANKKVQGFGNYIPFWNVSLQDLSMVGQNLKRGETWLKGIAAITVPTLLLKMANENNPDYQDLTPVDKAAFWHIYSGDKHIRIPIPWLLGTAFKVVAETFHDTAAEMLNQGDGRAEEAWKGLYHNFVENVSGSVPPMLQIYSEQIVGKTLPSPIGVFTQTESRAPEVVPKYLQGLEPRHQYTSKTSQIARKWGELWNVSPVKVERFIKGLGATSASTALALTDEIAYFTGMAEDKRPEQREANYLLLGNFVSNSPPSRTKYQSEFYDYLKEAEQRKRSQKLIQTKGLEESLEDLTYQSVQLGKYQRRIGKLFKDMRSAEENTSMSPAAKKSYLDSTQREINDLYKEAVEEVRTAKSGK